MGIDPSGTGAPKRIAPTSLVCLTLSPKTLQELWQDYLRSRQRLSIQSVPDQDGRCFFKSAANFAKARVRTPTASVRPTSGIRSGMA